MPPPAPPPAAADAAIFLAARSASCAAVTNSTYDTWPSPLESIMACRGKGPGRGPGRARQTGDKARGGKAQGKTGGGREEACVWLAAGHAPDLEGVPRPVRLANT